MLIGGGDQFKLEFLRISPNNRIPAIVDQYLAGPDYSIADIIAWPWAFLIGRTERTEEEEKARRELLFNQTNDKVRKAREEAAQTSP